MSLDFLVALVSLDSLGVECQLNQHEHQVNKHPDPPREDSEDLEEEKKRGSGREEQRFPKRYADLLAGIHTLYRKVAPHTVEREGGRGRDDQEERQEEKWYRETRCRERTHAKDDDEEGGER